MDHATGAAAAVGYILAATVHRRCTGATLGFFCATGKYRKPDSKGVWARPRHRLPRFQPISNMNARHVLSVPRPFVKHKETVHPLAMISHTAPVSTGQVLQAFRG